MPLRLQWHQPVTVLVCVLFLWPAPATAQLDKGLVVGWNNSEWIDPPNPTGGDVFESRNGFCAGMYLGGNFSKYFGLRTEALYTQKGAKAVSPGTTENGANLGEVDTFYNVDYLEVPLLITLVIPTGGAVRPMFLAGGAIDFQLSATQEVRYPGGVQNDFGANQALDTRTDTDFSWLFAGGVAIATGTKVITLQVRYIVGTEEIYAAARNRTLSVMAGFGI